MNIAQAVFWAQNKLKTVSPSPSLDSEVLLSFVLRKDRAWLYANPDHKLSSIQYSKFNILIRQRANHWPVALLTGHKEFFGLDFRVTPDVLIPRPETELLVELALDRISNVESRISNVIDVGTGSGAIIIALAVILSTKREESQRSFVRKRPQDDINFIAADISKSALKIAKQNARRHGVAKRIKFMRGNLLDPLFRLPFMRGKMSGGRSLIIANLPYLTPAQFNSNPNLAHEPRSALVGGSDGLKYYRRLFEQASKFHIQNSIFLLEHDPSQKQKLARLAKKYFPKAKLKFHRDLSDNQRISEIILG